MESGDDGKTLFTLGLYLPTRDHTGPESQQSSAAEHRRRSRLAVARLRSRRLTLPFPKVGTTSAPAP